MKKKLVAAILAGSMVFQSSGVLCVRAESLQDQTPETQMETEEESELQTGTADALRQTGKETAKKLVRAAVSLLGELGSGQEEQTGTTAAVEEESETAAPAETETEAVEIVTAETETEAMEIVTAETETEAVAIVTAETETEAAETAPAETETEAVETVTAEAETEAAETAPAETETETTETVTAEAETEAAETTPAETETETVEMSPSETETEAVELLQEETEFVFGSWNEEAPSLNILTEYVDAVTDPSSPDFIPEEDRVAVFDMDGTVFEELAPTYFDKWFFTWRVLDDPDYEADEDMTALANEVRACAARREDTPSVTQAAQDIFAGMTVQEYTDYVKEFLLQDVWGFEGLTYKEAFYHPMAEVVAYLNENNFKVYLVSGTDRIMCRTMIDGILDIEPEHVIGSDTGLAATGQGEEKGRDYTLQDTDEVVRTNELLVKNVKTNKVYQIIQEIGRQPVLSFGNSSGDTSMALYVTENNKYRSEAFFLVADDDERDWADAQEAEKQRQTWENYGFRVISMKDDFRTIYGDNATRMASAPEISYEEPETEEETNAAETETETVAAETEAVSEAAETEAAETEAVTEAAETEAAGTEAAETETESETAGAAAETEEFDIETLDRMRESENAETAEPAENAEDSGDASRSEQPQTERINGELYYEIQEGDNLWQVSEKLLGSGGRYQEIAQANDLEEPYDLMPGDRILIPAA